MSVEAEFEYALQLARERSFEEAAAAFAALVEQRPDWPEAHFNLARAQRDCSQIDKAINAYLRAIELRPDYAAAWYNLANVYLQLSRIVEATETYERVTKIEPRDRDAWFYLGVALLRLNALERAAAAFQKAVDLDPDSAAAQQLLAFASHSIGQIDVAEAAYERFLQHLPGDPSAIYSLGLIRLTRGDTARGWPAYEMRRALPNKRTMRSFDKPEWNGELLTGQTILLHAEQGIGDTLQAIRFAPLITKAGGRVVLVCPRPLVRLLETQLTIQQVIADGEPLPPFDLQVPMMSLPRIFGVTLETASSAKSYLRPRVDDVEEFREVSRERGLKIGLCWAGNPANTVDVFRSIQLNRLAPIGAVPDVIFFSLQVGKAAEQIASAPFPIVNVRSQLTDFAKTAALMDQLDLIITVETAVAHLAGALGRPTWLLTSFAADWRWLLDRRDSPWYPSMRLFRQPVLNDWDSVVSMVVRELKELRWKC